MVLQELSDSCSDASYQVTTKISHDPQVLNAYNFFILIFVNLECSFSKYKSILSCKRHNFTQENLAKYLNIIMHTQQFL